MAVYVTTGAPVPEGFTCVVPIEECVIADEKLSLQTAIPVNKWIRAIGCDIATGQTVLSAGQVLSPPEIGLLASVGAVTDIPIVRPPTVGLLSTGDELVAASTEQLPPGKIRDSNKVMLTSLL